MPTSSRSARLFLAAAAAAVAVAVAVAVTGCCDARERTEAPLGRSADNPTPYQAVLAVIEAGSRMPEAGDDLTLYLHEPADPALRPPVWHASLVSDRLARRIGLF